MSTSRFANSWSTGIIGGTHSSTSETTAPALAPRPPEAAESADSADFAGRESTAEASDSEAGLEGDAPRFPIEHLPPRMRGIAAEVAAAHQVPESLTACCALGICSAAMGAGLEVETTPGRVTRGNLFLMIVAQSGTGKSVAFSSIARAYFDLEIETLKDWERNTLPGLKASIAILESRKRSVEKSLEKAGTEQNILEAWAILKEIEGELSETKAKMRAPRWTCGDSTKEALQQLLDAAPGEALACMSPDARDVVDVVAGRYRKGVTDEAVFLSGYSGDTCRVDRKGSPPLVLHRPCLVVLWCLQPDKAREILTHPQLAESGLFQRFLLCDTEAEPQEEPEHLPAVSAESAESWRDLLGELATSCRNAQEPTRVLMAAAGKDALREWGNRFVRSRRSGGTLADLSSWAARWKESATRLALVLHAAEHGASAKAMEVSASTVEAAIQIMEWFIDQQLRLIHPARVQKWSEGRDRLLEVLRRYTDQSATLRDLARRHDIKRAEVEAAARHWPDVFLIETVKTNGAGRPSRVVSIAPPN